MRGWITAALIGLAAPAWAEGEPAGDFDYYVMSLSWSPNWCALEGRAKDSPQCDRGRGFGWVLHGLWPQNERGWPSFCRTGLRDPSRGETAQMADIMGTSGLAWYQWKKHGRCAGLSASDYYATAREAYGSVTRPEVFRRLKDPITLPASVVEEAWLKDNPDLTAEMLTVTCKGGHIQEVRICLTKTLEPRSCGADVSRDCRMQDAAFEPIR
ncbi:ribonuclease T2 family protein [Vannielia litorea]|uniref:Ribonuclease T2 n=1 Tax=Vannielia litorea TaxID=1217970 RepID=A0A1N6ICB6_9RHOB|nr:ribonuclease T2 [Vannielia litorea]SIO29605.1 ribonuclease T2 [Vannielia litorea]